MKHKYKIAGALVGITAAIVVLELILHGVTISVLMPRGIIAMHQRNLMLWVFGLMLIVVIPVFILTFVFAWRYRASNTTALYTPNWDGNKTLELTWWLIPFALITVLSIIIWVSSHTLDPYRSISSAKQPVTIQVVAMQWKWLFIYPEQGIASVNYLQIPKDTPINFEITSDAAMNSFWIPQLGGQIYAMAGMNSQLHLMANSLGTYRGSSANLSGAGFAGMTFTAESTRQEEFDSWVEQTREAHHPLDAAGYKLLNKPSKNNPPDTYSSVVPGLYDTVMHKYMAPGQNMAGMELTQ